MSAFERGDYAVAAERFLDADAIVPSSDALANALSAAERARDPALLERAAARAIARESREPELARTARRLLAESKATTATRSATPAPASTGVASPAATATEPQPLGAPAHDRNAAPAQQKPHASDREHAWPPAVFYAGAAGTAVLLGVTIWSGVDALDARDSLPETPTRGQNDSVRARAHRTDAFLAGTIVLAVATTYVGLARVKWGEQSKSVALGGTLDGQGAVVSAWGNW